MSMFIDPCRVGEIRRKLGITQRELAKLAGVSQSFIAKLESGKIDPTYSKYKQVIDALAKLSFKKDVKVGDIMVRNIIHADVNETVKEVAEKMLKHAISQVPVFDGDKLVGMVTESTILNGVAGGMKMSEVKVSKIMEAPPPILPEDTPLVVAVQLLKFYPIILVSERGEIAGLISKADIIGFMRETL
ncbi:MAG: CBS domain-containing protein [Candidatus Methanomethylicia archaeon]